MKIVIILLVLIVLALGGGVAGLYLGLIPVGEPSPATEATPEPTVEPTPEEPEEPMTPELMGEILNDSSRMAPLGSNGLEEYYKTKMQKNVDGASGATVITNVESLGDKEFSAIDYEDSKERYKAKKRVRNDISQQQWELEKENFSGREDEEKKLNRARAMEKWVEKNKSK